MALMQEASGGITRFNFHRLIERFQRPLLAYATQIIGDRERAHDCVQETFMQLEKRTRDHAQHVSAKWLFTVCRNRSLNVCRKERRLAYLGEDVLEGEPSPEHSPAHHLEEKEASHFLMHIVRKLPPRQQEVLQLRFQNDLSYQEISEITGLSVSNVGLLIHTAIKTLRSRYAPIARQYLETSSRKGKTK